MKKTRRLVTQAGTVVLAVVVGSVVVSEKKIFSLINTDSFEFTLGCCRLEEIAVDGEEWSARPLHG